MFLQESFLTLIYYWASDKLKVHYSSTDILNYLTVKSKGCLKEEKSVYSWLVEGLPASVALDLGEQICPRQEAPMIPLWLWGPGGKNSCLGWIVTLNDGTEQMRLHRVLLSVPICALYTRRKADIMEYRSVLTRTILTVSLTFPSAFIIVMMLPGRFWKSSVQKKKPQDLSLYRLILCNSLIAAIFTRNRLSASLRTKPQLMHISSQGLHEPVCQGIMRFFSCGFWSWPRETMRGRSAVTVYCSYSQWMDGQKLYWE